MYYTQHLGIVAATNDVSAAPAIPTDDENNVDTVCTKFREYETRKSMSTSPVIIFANEQKLPTNMSTVMSLR